LRPSRHFFDLLREPQVPDERRQDNNAEESEEESVFVFFEHMYHTLSPGTTTRATRLIRSQYTERDELASLSVVCPDLPKRDGDHLMGGVHRLLSAMSKMSVLCL